MEIDGRPKLCAILAWLVSSVLFFVLSFGPAIADGQISIGVIQYNAKGGQPHMSPKGWSSAEIINKQVTLVADKMRENNPAPVQFITLVQASDPLISHELAKLDKNPISGWNTVRGGCEGGARSNTYYEGTQIAYSPEWKLAPNSVAGMHNPLADSFTSSHCFSSGRPYNIAYFQNKKNNDLKVLVIIIHPPHCSLSSGNSDEMKQCMANYDEFDNYDDDVRKVTGTAKNDDLSGINTIISGDTNELGNVGVPDGQDCPDFKGDGNVYKYVFPQFGDLSVSTIKAKKCFKPGETENGTCCQSSTPRFSNYFDRVVVNRSVADPYEEIIDIGAYPLIPNAEPKNEEHKAIYAVVTFPAPK